MAEPEDAVVPILRSIQTEISRLGARIDNQGEVLLRHGDKLEAIEGYLTHMLGHVSRHQADIGTLQAEIKARISALESRT